MGGGGRGGGERNTFERDKSCRYNRNVPVGGLWTGEGGGREIRVREIKAVVMTGIFQ